MKEVNPGTRAKNIRLYEYIMTELKTRHGIFSHVSHCKTGNVRLLVRARDRQTYSVIRLAHTRVFRIFSPAQSRTDIKHWEGVVKYLAEIQPIALKPPIDVDLIDGTKETKEFDLPF
jgi:hypothetical protein